MLRLGVVLAVAVSRVAGHGALVSPPSRNSLDKNLPEFAGGKSPDTPCTCANGLLDKDVTTVQGASGETCWTDEGHNYNNHTDNIAIVTNGMNTTGDCCSACSAHPECKFFTFYEGRCYLKKSDYGRSPLRGAVSGGFGTKPSSWPGSGGGPVPGGGCDQGIREGAGGQPCLWWSQGCECATVGGPTTPITGYPPHADKIGFRRRYCNSTFNATLPKYAWTMNIDAVEGSVNDSFVVPIQLVPIDTLYRYNPWRAPGYAPVIDACGQAGGKYKQTPIGGDSVYTTTKYATMGDLGSKVLPKGPAGATWVAGSQVQVTWGMRYNHGGGYQYRLCKADTNLSESCFQQTPLEFDRTKQALIWLNGTRLNITGVFVDKGTWPIGSTWARNPIPRIADDNRGNQDAALCPGPGGRSGPGCMQFPAPCPQDTGPYPWSTDGSGQGACSGDWTMGVISDEVIIPKDLTPGDYVLSWRWDAEETAQIWSNCADVTIVAAE